ADQLADRAHGADVQPAARLWRRGHTDQRDIRRGGGSRAILGGAEPPPAHHRGDERNETRLGHGRRPGPHHRHAGRLTSTPITSWPARARHAAVTHPTCPRPKTLTNSHAGGLPS